MLLLASPRTFLRTAFWAADVHVICDNYTTHKTQEIQAWLAHPPPRIQLQFTPTG